MRLTTLLLVAIVVLQPSSGVASAQRAISPAEERDGWRDAASAMPPGVTVKVELKSGRRLIGTMMAVTEEGLLVKERSRKARPALLVPLADIARIERANKDGAGSIGKAIAAGAAAGVGGFLTFLAVALMVTD